jgi:hypothetical protein
MTGRQTSRAVERFLLDLVRVDADRERLLSTATHLPVELVLAEATDHGVVGLLMEAAQSAPQAWPAMTAASAEQWSSHVAWTMRLLVELREVVEALDAAGLAHVVLKGPVLGGPLYGDPLCRPSSDLDLLVHRADRERVAEVLGLGVDVTAADATGSGQVSAHLRRGTPLDLHWEVVNDPAVRRATGLDTATLLARRRTVTVSGTEVATLDPVDTVLHLVSHALVSGGHRLVWYADLDRALRAPALDLTELSRRAQDARLSTGLALLAGRCHTHLGTRAVPATGSRVWSALGRRSRSR